MFGENEWNKIVVFFSAAPQKNSKHIKALVMVGPIARGWDGRKIFSKLIMICRKEI
jgi:hypothetical protein